MVGTQGGDWKDLSLRQFTAQIDFQREIVVSVFKTPVLAAGGWFGGGELGMETQRLERSRRKLRSWAQAAARPWEWRWMYFRDVRP